MFARNANAYRGLVSQIAARAQCSAFILDYPLAPEASIPAALDLARTAVDRLIAIYPRIAIVGDSAGGGLTLATLYHRKLGADGTLHLLKHGEDSYAPFASGQTSDG